MLDRYERGEISREEYIEENQRLWEKAGEEYSTIENGEFAEMRRSEASVPKRANKKGKLVNEFHNALSGKEWRMFYEEIANAGYLGKTKVGTAASVVVGDKLVVAERKYTGKDAHDYVVTNVYKLYTEDGNNFMLSLLQNESIKGDISYDDTRGFLAFVNEIHRDYGGVELLARYDKTSSRFDIADTTGVQTNSSWAVYRDSQEGIVRGGLSLRDKSSVQENNELLRLAK